MKDDLLKELIEWCLSSGSVDDDWDLGYEAARDDVMDFLRKRGLI